MDFSKPGLVHDPEGTTQEARERNACRGHRKRGRQDQPRKKVLVHRPSPGALALFEPMNRRTPTSLPYGSAEVHAHGRGAAFPLSPARPVPPRVVPDNPLGDCALEPGLAPLDRLHGWLRSGHRPRPGNAPVDHAAPREGGDPLLCQETMGWASIAAPSPHGQMRKRRNSKASWRSSLK